MSHHNTHITHYRALLQRVSKLAAVCACGVFLSACGLEFSDADSSAATDTPDSVSDAAPSPGPENTAGDNGEVFSATLSWDIPTERENGSALPLSEIGGYEIVYRKADSTEYQLLVIDDHTAQSTTINDLTTGEYEFKIASFDSTGMYGQYSSLIYASIGS